MCYPETKPTAQVPHMPTLQCCQALQRGQVRQLAVRAFEECSFSDGHSGCLVDHTCTVCLSTVLTYPPPSLTCMHAIKDSASTCTHWLFGLLSNPASSCIAKARGISAGLLSAPCFQHLAPGTRLQGFQQAHRQRPGLAGAEGSGVQGACACVEAHHTPFVLSGGMRCHQVSMHPLCWNHLYSCITLSRQEGRLS